MKLGFEETQTPYTSGSQSARSWTERWARDQVFCPNCGSPKISAFPPNQPVADFFCPACKEEYEQEPKNKVWEQRNRRRIPHDVRTARCQQQSELVPSQIRSQTVRRHRSFRCPQTFLCAGNNSR